MRSIRSRSVLISVLLLLVLSLGCAPLARPAVHVKKTKRTATRVPSEADLSAMRAKPGVDTALVYVYWTPLQRTGSPDLAATANGSLIGSLGENSFLYFRSYPGKVALAVGNIQRDIMVQPGQAYFMKFFDRGSYEMVMVSANQGRSEISSLTLAPLTDVAIVNLENRPTGQARRLMTPPPPPSAADLSGLAAAGAGAGGNALVAVPLVASEPEEPVDPFAAAFADCEKSGKASCYRLFLRKCADCEQRPKALETLAGLVVNKRQQQNPLTSYGQFVKAYPDGLQYIPAKYQIFFIGPEGLTPYDLVLLRKERISDRIIAKKVLASSGPYKDFSFDEMRLMKKQGLSDPLIEAMLQVDAREREKVAAQAAEEQAEQERIAEAQRQEDEAKRQAEAEEEQQRKTELAAYEQQRQEAIAACQASCDEQRRQCLEQVKTARLGGGSLLERAFNLANTAMTAANCVDAATCRSQCQQ